MGHGAVTHDPCDPSIYVTHDPWPIDPWSTLDHLAGPLKTGPADPAITISKELHYGCARDFTLIVQPNYLYHASYTLSGIFIFLENSYFSINLWFVCYLSNLFILLFLIYFVDCFVLNFLASFLSDEPYQHRTCNFPKRHSELKNVEGVFKWNGLTNRSGFTTMKLLILFSVMFVLKLRKKESWSQPPRI